jgi:shikimate kinase
MRNIVLVGLMGAGKSTVGKFLAQKLEQFNFVDIDEEIVREEKMSIPEIFSQKSEDYFRNIETEVIRKISSEQNLIISTGGGAFEREENRKLLNKNGKTFYLYAPIDILFERLKDDNSRPLLRCDNPKEKLANLLITRENNYKKSSFIIDTENKTIEQIVNEIVEKYND